MPDLTIPDISIVVRPASAIPFRNRPGFLICDILGDLLNLGQGDSQGVTVQDQNPTISDSWMQSGLSSSQWKDFNNVSFIRFLKDGTFREGASAQAGDANSDLFGVIIQGRTAYLDSKISGTTLDGGFTDLNWEVIQGTWESVNPPSAPTYLRIRPTGSGATHKARMVGYMEKNRSFCGDVRFVSQGRTSNQSAARLDFGKYSICWRHSQKITVETYRNGAWQIMRALDMEPANLAGGRYTFSVRRIAGRMCISINGHNYQFMATSEASLKPSLVDIDFNSIVLQFNCFHCRGTLGVGVIKYSQPNDQPFIGQFSRQARKSVPVRLDEEAIPPTMKFRGWQRGGTDITSEIQVATYIIDYVVTLTASPKGVDTPFVSACLLKFSPQWRTPTVAGVDLRPALKSLRVTLPSLPSAAVGECTIELDRSVLSQQIPTWETYLDKYHPLEIQIRRKYDDGSYLDADWVPLFKGYVYKNDYGLNGPNDFSITVTGRDPSLRLQKPAGMIDHRFPPLDVLYMFGNAQARETLAMYGCDGVQEILRRAVGDAEADALNGNGNGLRFFGSGSYPLLDFANDTGGFIHIKSVIEGTPPSKGGLMFPAPYGEDAISWIGKMQEYDKAVFYYGWADDNRSGWPVPIYGRIPILLQGRSLTIIPDQEYVSGDKNGLLLQATTEQRPDLDINRVLVLSNPFGKEATEFMPALRMAVDQLEMPDTNAPERAWERTAVVRENIGALPGVAEFIASTTVDLLANNTRKWPNCVIRGNPYLQWGDKVAFNLSGAESDPTIGLNYNGGAGPSFRCQRVEHVIDLSAADIYTTELQTRPLARGVL